MPIRVRNLSKYNDLPHIRHDSIGDLLLKPLKTSLNSFKSNNRWFDFIYEDNDSPVTLVVFHAAVPVANDSYPIFSSRWIAKKFGANYLGFADPACGGMESLPTYWFQDTKRVKTTQFVEAVISHAMKNGHGKNLIFFGASAGGFAALRYSALFTGSLALVMNPRINLLARPDNFQDYSSLAYPGWSESTVKKLVLTDVSKIYTSPTRNTVIYLQNLQDKNYHGYHYTPFRKKALSENKIYYKTGNWGKGHIVPPREVYEELLQTLIAKAPDWSEVVDHN